MKSLNVSPSKIYDYIYPLYAREFLFGDSFDEFIKLVKKDFKLTPEQIGSLMTEWENKEFILSDNKLNTNEIDSTNNKKSILLNIIKKIILIFFGGLTMLMLYNIHYIINFFN